MVRSPSTGSGGFSSPDRVRLGAAQIRSTPPSAGNGAGRGAWLCGRLRAGSRRDRAVAGEDEPNQRDQCRGFGGGGGARREHAAPGGRSGKPKIVLAPRPGEPEGQRDRWKYFHERGRAEVS